MKKVRNTFYFTPTEERLNIITHAIGVVLSIIALPLLIIRACLNGNVWHIVSFSIFGASLIVLYAASTLYHAAKKQKIRNKLNVFDHISIYILIAGTYTPFVLVTLHGIIGWIIFGLSWGLALIGIVLKFFFIGKYDLLSTIMYVALGWMIIFAVKPLIDNLPTEGLFWLGLGGMLYTLGAILYQLKKIKFNHAIFHVFVLTASFSHFMAVYFYVI